MTVSAWPYRLARSFETTTHVRVFLGSTPTEGSQLIQRTSPRRYSSDGASTVGAGGGRRLECFIAEDLELPGLQLGEQRGVILPAAHIIGGELALALRRFATREGLAEELSRHLRARPSRTTGGPPQP